MGNNGFIIPSLVYLYLGASAEKVLAFFQAGEENTEEAAKVKRLEITLVCVGAVALTTVICLVGHLTKRELDKMVGKEEARSHDIEMVGQ
jgi:hypothetical protein